MTEKPKRGDPPNVPRKETWEWEKSRAEYDARRIAYLGGGLAGLGLFGAGDMGANIFAEVQWLRAMFVVAALATAAFLGLAWATANQFATEIDRDHNHELKRRAERKLPKALRWYRRTALLLLLVTALLLVAAGIVAAIRPDPSG